MKKVLQQIVYLLLSIAIMSIFIACGGSGGGDSSSSTNNNGGDSVATTDKIAPIITILGDNPITVKQHSTYIDAGATAIDNIDGVVLVKSSSSVNTSIIGTYAVTYSATDKAENKATKKRTVKVVKTSNNKAPTADAGEDKSVMEGRTIHLVGKGTDSDGTIVAYEWKNGKKVLSKTASFNYAPRGNYGDIDILTFTVTDNDGASDSDTIGITIQEFLGIPPKADAGKDQSVVLGKTIKLVGKGTDSDGKIVSYEWSENETVIARTASFNYTPSEIGQYSLTLTVTDNDGYSTDDSVIVTVNKVVDGNKAPTVNAGEDKSVVVNKSVTLTGTATDSDGSIVSYEWKKGTEVLATTASFIYKPTKVGKETLIFSAIDDEDATSSDSMVITVNKGISSNKPLILTIQTTSDMWFPNDHYFELNVKDKEGYKYNYNIDWGDGKIDQGESEDITHYFDKAGVYTIKIDGDFPTFNFVQENRIISVEQWGSIKWKDMHETFKNCRSLKMNATDVPDFSDVNDTSNMFARANKECFPSSMSQWNMSSVKNMEYMFEGTEEDYSKKPALTQDLSSWNVSSVTNMEKMFRGSYYNGDFSKWDVSKVKNMESIFRETKLSSKNYDKLLNAWSKLNLQKNITFGLTKGNNYDKTIGTQYTSKARVARELLKSKFKWKIEDSGIDIYNLEEFKPWIATWETNSYGDPQITIPADNGFYQYNIDWGDGTTDENVTEIKTHTYANEGNYSIKISGNYPHYSSENDRNYIYGKLVDITQWGDNEWKSMYNSFGGRYLKEFTISATDAPNLSAVTNISYMFARADFDSTFNSPIGDWDVSNITNMSNVFSDAREFNQDLSSWDVSNVTNMSNMFSGAINFNQDIGSWNTSNVTDMSSIFRGAKAFNQDISSWDISKISSMYYMFAYTDSFNQDLSNWNTSNVSNMAGVFNKAKEFNQDISSWDYSLVNYIDIEESSISTENYSKLILSLNNQNLKDSGSVNAGTIKYNKEAQTSRFELINKHKWRFRDGGLAE